MQPDSKTGCINSSQRITQQIIVNIPRSQYKCICIRASTLFSSTFDYSGFFHLDESTSKFPLLAASQRSLRSHSQCLLHTYFSHAVFTFGREIFASVPALPREVLPPIPALQGELLSLCLSCAAWRTSLAQSWSAWQISFSRSCFSVSQRLCTK